MKVKTKIIDKSIPTPALKYALEGDAGIDLTATSVVYDEYGNVCYGTNRAFEIPKGYVGLLFPRSSNAKKDLILSNSVGLIDCGYRGEIFFKFKPSAMFQEDSYVEGISGYIGDSYDYVGLPDEEYLLQSYEVGDRIGQLLILPYPEIEFEEVDELSNSERGSGSYGSTGK